MTMERSPTSDPSPQGVPSKDAASQSSDWGFGRPLFKNPWFYFALVIMGALTVTRPLLRHVPDPLPVLLDVPSFSFLSTEGAMMGSQELAGNPYVVSFIFTRCTTACPLITQRMAELQKQLRDGGLPVRLLSLTVDPDHDRPQTLEAYADQFGVDKTTWTFLTSPESMDAERYARAIEQTFGVAVESAGLAPGMSPMDLAHSERLLLIDAKGRLRGLFAATPEGVNEIFHRSVSLMGEPKS
jgi:protein SCO1/2